MIWDTCQNLMVVKLHFLDGLHTQHTSVGWMEHFSLAWVKQFQCFLFFHFKSHVYFAYLELVSVIHCWIHETLMYVSCVFIWLLRGRNMVCFPVSCWFFESYIEGEFLLFMILLYHHAFLYLWSWVVLTFFLFHICFNEFCWVFQETWHLLSICDKKG